MCVYILVLKLPSQTPDTSFVGAGVFTAVVVYTGEVFCSALIVQLLLTEDALVNMKEKVTAFSKTKKTKNRSMDVSRLPIMHSKTKIYGGGDIDLQSSLRCIKLQLAKRQIWYCYPSQL